MRIGITQGRVPSLRTALLGSFLAIILVTTIAAFAAVGSIRGAYLELSSMQSVQGDVVRLRSIAGTLHNAEINYLRSANPEYRQENRGTKLAFETLVRNLEGRAAPMRPGYFRDLRAMMETYASLSVQAEEALQSGTERIYMDRLSAELGRYISYVGAQIDTILNAYMERAQTRSEELRARIETSENISSIAFMLIALLIVLLAVRIADAIARPIHGLAVSLQRFASGELDPPSADENGPAEIGLVARSFNSMTPRIRRLVELEQEKTALSDRLLLESTRALELENSLQKSELELLQARINPHFMFNALASIGSLARLEDAGRTARSVDSLARIMRHSFTADREHATVGEELEIVRHYLALQKTRFGARLCFEVECAPEVESRSLPGLSVQPFVENAVLHGIEPREQGGNVTVKACMDDSGGTLIVISDDGVGFDPAGLAMAVVATAGSPATSAGTQVVAESPSGPPAATKDAGLDGNRSHYGIANVKRRLELLFGEGTVRIESGRGRGTMVELRIPAPPFAGGQTDLPLEQA